MPSSSDLFQSVCSHFISKCTAVREQWALNVKTLNNLHFDCHHSIVHIYVWVHLHTVHSSTLTSVCSPCDLSLVIMMCCRSDVMASVLTRLVCVALVTSLLVFYLLAGGSSDPSELDKREVRDWAKVDLLARDLPSDIKERVSGVRIEESHHDIHGANTFTQVRGFNMLDFN